MEGWIAAPIVTLAFGAIAIFALILRGKHRDSDKKINRLRIASMFVLGAGLHSFGAALWMHWAMFLPIEQIVKDQFGERICWVMAAACLDYVLRIWDALDLVGAEALRKVR